jgi:uncharacterized membrane protein
MSQQSSFKMRPWVRVLLIASVTLNLIIVGMAVGAAWRFGGKEWDRPPKSVGTLMFRELSREDRRHLRDRAEREHGDFRARRYEDAHAVAEALRQVPFDPERLRGLLEAQSQRRETFQQDVQRLWIARVTEMSDGQRADYAERLEEGLMRRKDHHHGDRRHD